MPARNPDGNLGFLQFQRIVTIHVALVFGSVYSGVGFYREARQ